MQDVLKIWQAFKDHFSQAYRRYQIRNKATAVSHGYVTAANNTHKTEVRVNTEDALQELSYS